MLVEFKFHPGQSVDTPFGPGVINHCAVDKDVNRYLITDPNNNTWSIWMNESTMESSAVIQVLD